MSNQLEYLDELVEQVANDNLDAYYPLSTGERVYVALAASRSDLLKQDEFTIIQALDWLDESWLKYLFNRWKASTSLT